MLSTEDSPSVEKNKKTKKTKKNKNKTKKPQCIPGLLCCGSPEAPIAPTVHVSRAAWSCATQPAWPSVEALLRSLAPTATNHMILYTNIDKCAVPTHAS